MKYYEEYIINNNSNNKYKVIVKNYGKNDIYVENIDTKVRYKILNKFYLNRCFDLDIVEISDIENNIVENDNENDDEIYSEYSSDDELEDKQNIKHCKNKRIIKKIEENNKIYNTPIGGILEINTLKKYGVNKRNIPYFKFKPLDKQYPPFLVASSCKKKYKKNVYCTVGFKEWNTQQLYPYGIIDEVYGEIDNYEALQKILIKKYELNNSTNLSIEEEDIIFEFDIITKQKILNYKMKNNRKKYLFHDIISIDPKNCRDIDDAFHCNEDDNYYEIYIHISDVSEYIKLNSTIDKMAKTNYTTIYNNNNNIEMLPKLLSHKLCSLNKQNDYNLAITIKFIFDKETCNLYDVFIYDSIIKVNHNLSYEEGQQLLDNTQISQDDSLYNVSKSIKILSYISNEIDTHKIIEYFMILTNNKICELIHNNLNFSILRNYKQYNRIETINNDENFIKFLNFYHNESAKYKIIKGKINTNEYNHELLNLKYYTHFTSPIRRYIDIEMHRLYKLLNNKIEFNKDVYIEKLDNICENINKKNKYIKKYYRELEKIKLIYMKPEIFENNIFEAYIINIMYKETILNNNKILKSLYLNIYIKELNIVYNYNILGNNRDKILDIEYEIKDKINNLNNVLVKNKATQNKLIFKKYALINIELYSKLLKNDINKIELCLKNPDINLIL